MGLIFESSHEKRTRGEPRIVDRKSVNRKLRFVPSETTVAAIGLMILTYLSWTEINSIDIIWPPSPGWVIRLALPFFRFALFGIFTTTGAIIAILLASGLNVSVCKNNAPRNLVRIYLIAMFLLVLIDLILHAVMGYTILRLYGLG